MQVFYFSRCRWLTYMWVRWTLTYKVAPLIIRFNSFLVSRLIKSGIILTGWFNIWAGIAMRVGIKCLDLRSQVILKCNRRQRQDLGCIATSCLSVFVLVLMRLSNVVLSIYDMKEVLLCVMLNESQGTFLVDMYCKFVLMSLIIYHLCVSFVC